MKKIVIILQLLSLMHLQADEPLFLKANNEYSNQNYHTAISYYDSILNKELVSSELYYNLGNCYYRNKDWAKAIWNYEKSLQIKKDEKTIYNLQLTQKELKDQIKPFPRIFYKIWLESLVSYFTTKTWQIITIVLIWITFLVKITNNPLRLSSNIYSKFLVILSLCSLLISCVSIKVSNKKEAIIFTTKVNVNSAPSINSTNLFILHSGIKVEIIDSINEWSNIKLENGNTGWIKNVCFKEL